jgi:mono/diheme cytochrome c family protein
MAPKGLASIAAAAIVYAGVAGVITLHAAQDATTPPTSLANALPPDADGEYIFRNNCATCHGPDGKGSPQSVIGFDAPLPDFTDCPTNTVEPFGDWNSVVHRGGPIRGLDHHMPAFADALSDDQIESVIKYLWTLCDDPTWPRGDLNFPRAFFTEKAFPESETVWTTAITTKGARAVGNQLVYEHRIRQRSQYEITIPLDFQQTSPSGGWVKGLGDVEFALRRSFWASLDHAAIFAAGGAVTLPTGKEERGLGSGVTVWEPFAMFAKGIGANGFLQMHGGIELPTDTATQPRETFLRGVYGYTYAVDHGFGRSWTPMAEVVTARESGGELEMDIVPQMQVSLSKLQHVLLSVGVAIPATERQGRHPQFLTYFLWDWFDGGLFQYWH